MAFADQIAFKMELDPDTAKKAIEAGVRDEEKAGGYKIKPAFINDDPQYSLIPPYKHSKLIR